MYTPINQWAEDDRPREKMIERGFHALNDAEVIAILLATGTRELSALDLARKLLAHFGGLDKLARASVLDLTAVHGIGPAKAISILAAFEINRRRSEKNKGRSGKNKRSVKEKFRAYSSKMASTATVSSGNAWETTLSPL